MLPEQARRQRRRQRQRIDRRDHRRNRNGHCELLVELAGDAGQEGHRHEHRAQHQRDRDDRPGDLLHRLVRRGQRAAAFLDVALDVLHDHDRIVHDDADRQHEPEQRQGVDREAEQQQRGERPDDRHRYRDQRDDRSTPGLQEQDHHQHDQQHRFHQGGDHRLDRVAHEDGGVVDRLVFDTRRKTLGELVHPRDRRVPDLEGVGARRLEDTDRGRFLAVQPRTQGVVAGGQLQPCNVGEPHDLAVGAALEHDVAELLGRAQAALRVDQREKVAAVRHRLGAELAGRDLDVLLADRAHDVTGGQAARSDLVRIQPDPHGVVAAAEDLRVADAGNPRQLVLHVQAHVVAQVERVVLAVRRHQVHHHEEDGRLLQRRHPLPSHVLGQPRERLRDAVLHAHCRVVRIGAGSEGNRHLQDAVGAGDRLEVRHVLDAVDRLLERRRHGLGDHLGVGAGIDRAHHDRGRHHFRVFADRQQRDRDQARGKDHDRKHRGEDRPVDEELREIHSVSLWRRSGRLFRSAGRHLLYLSRGRFLSGGRSRARRLAHRDHLRRHRHSGDEHLLHAVHDHLVGRLEP